MRWAGFITCLILSIALNNIVHSGESQPTKAGDKWVMRIHDLRPLLEPVRQYEKTYGDGTVDESIDHVRQRTATLITVLKDATGAAHWIADEATINLSGGKLYIMQQEAVHVRIRQVLQELTREAKQQVRIQVRVLKAAALERREWELSKLDDLLAQGEVGEVIRKTEVTCYNGQSALTLGGREHSYLESFVATTEGGGMVGGVREANSSPLLEGLTAIVRPLILPEDDYVEVTLRLSLLDRISFRSPTLSEKLAIAMGTEQAGQPKEPLPNKKANDERAELFGMPTRDAATLRTQIQVPKGKWVVAGAVNAPDEKAKLLLVLVSAEVVKP